MEGEPRMRLFAFPGALYRGLHAGYGLASSEAQARTRVVRLVNEKRSRGLTAVEACELVGVPVSTYYRWWKCLRAGGVKGNRSGFDGRFSLTQPALAVPDFDSTLSRTSPGSYNRVLSAV